MRFKLKLSVCFRFSSCLLPFFILSASVSSCLLPFFILSASVFHLVCFRFILSASVLHLACFHFILSASAFHLVCFRFSACLPQFHPDYSSIPTVITLSPKELPTHCPRKNCQHTVPERISIDSTWPCVPPGIVLWYRTKKLVGPGKNPATNLTSRKNQLKYSHQSAVIWKHV